MARNSIGNGRLYLFTHPGNTKLIITAHGTKQPGNFRIPVGCTLWFCSQHGKSTATDVDDILTSFTSNARHDLIKEVGFHPFLQNECNEYSLSKFAGKRGGGEWENYNVYANYVMQGADILSPRNRFYSRSVRLSYVLNIKEIQDINYRHIYCSFCRC
jgi:hypothetical protein